VQISTLPSGDITNIQGNWASAEVGAIDNMSTYKKEMTTYCKLFEACSKSIQASNELKQRIIRSIH